MNFGIKIKELQGALISNADCSACNKASLRNTGIVKLFHISGLPLFPVGGSSLVACGSCGISAELKHVSDGLREKASPVITPKALLLSSWGMLIVVLVLAGVLYLGISGKQEDRAFIAAPQIGDLYIVRIADFIPTQSADTFPYGVLKITNVDNGHVSFAVANATYGNLKSVRKSLRSDSSKKDFFSDVQIESETANLTQKFEVGAIQDVQR